MQHVGIVISFQTNSVQWIDWSISMKEPHYYDELMMTDDFEEWYEDENTLVEAYAELFEAVEILERAYKKVTPKEYSCRQDHITVDEQSKFKSVLEQHKVRFDRELCLYIHKKFHLELKEGAVLVHKNHIQYHTAVERYFDGNLLIFSRMEYYLQLK